MLVETLYSLLSLRSLSVLSLLQCVSLFTADLTFIFIFIFIFNFSRSESESDRSCFVGDPLLRLLRDIKKIGDRIRYRIQPKDKIKFDSESDTSNVKYSPNQTYGTYSHQYKIRRKPKYKPRQVDFYANSYMVGINNHCTSCICNNLNLLSLI